MSARVAWWRVERRGAAMKPAGRARRAPRVCRPVTSVCRRGARSVSVSTTSAHLAGAGGSGSDALLQTIGCEGRQRGGLWDRSIDHHREEKE